MSIFPFLNTQVESFLNTLPEPITCLKDNAISNVIETLSSQNIGAMIILDKEKKVIGIFTERDYLVKLATHKEIDSTKVSVGDYMTEKPLCVTGKHTIGKVLAIMRLKKFRHIIVTNNDGTLCKVISIKDALDWLSDTLAEY